jgi:hypothetical protein
MPLSVTDIHNSMGILPESGGITKKEIIKKQKLILQ